MSSGHPEPGPNHVLNRVFNRVLNRVMAVGLGLLVGGHATPAAADFVEWQFESDPIEVEGETYSVVDVYAAFDDPADAVLSVFNSSITTSTGIEFHHDDFNTIGGLAGAWNGVQSDEIPGVIDARIDSFVLVGGEIGSGNSTTLDPSFDPGTGGTVAANAGWFNSNPPNLQGRVDPVTLRTRIARFVIESTVDPTTLIFSANLGYNKGFGTPAQFAYDNGQGSGPTIETAFAYVCDILSLDPASTAFSSQGGGSSFLVSIADQQCDWLAETDADWIALDVGAGTGDGVVEFTVAENPAAVVRSGEILVNGVSHAVEQDAAPCAVILADPPAADFPLEGGAGAFTVATNGPDCSWNAFSSASWVAITGGGSGTGESGEISYTVAANPNAFKRTAVVVVGAVAHSIVQAPAPCAVTSLDVETASFDAMGGEGTVTVSTNGAVCSWSATSSAPWLTISAGGSGTGSQGEIVYSVAPNPVAAIRTGEIAVGGLVLAVEQAAAPCSVLAISSEASDFGFEGGAGSFDVTTNGEVCEWSASSSVDWIVLDAGSGGGVVSTLSFTVLENEIAKARAGEILVDGLVHAVNQAAAPCVVTAVDPGGVEIGAAGGSQSVAITTNGSGCPWSGTTSEDWIALDVSEGVGDGTLEFTIAASPVTLPRSGSIEVGGLVVSVSQEALPCAVVAIDPDEATFDFVGGDVAFAISTNGDNCDWTASTDAEWVSIVEGGSGTGSNGTISVEVAIYDGVESRMATITVGSQTVSIGQTGGPDCNANGLGDGYEVLEGLVPDCNDNGVPDSCDIADGTSEDLNDNGIPDECEQDLVVAVPADYPTIQDAIDDSLDGWTIQVAPGVYNEQIALGNRRIVLEAWSGLGETVLDGDGLPGSVVTMIGSEGDTEPGPTLRGFTVTGGTLGTLIGTSTTLFGGGGVYTEWSHGRIESCRIVDNSANFGGGIYLWQSEVELLDCEIVSNNAAADGGGLQFFRGANRAIGCLFEANDAIARGGGLHDVRSLGELVDCTFVGNLADLGGGISVFAEAESLLTISGCSITDNLVKVVGAGVWIRPGFVGATFENSLVCGNLPDEISGDFNDLGGNELCICPADLTGNDTVNGADLAELLAVWGPCPDGPCTEADLNDDGIVDGADLSVMLSSWGPCP